MFKWSGWNKYTRNKLNQIAAGGGGGGEGGGGGGGVLICETEAGPVGLKEITTDGAVIAEAFLAGTQVLIYTNDLYYAAQSMRINSEDLTSGTIYISEGNFSWWEGHPHPQEPD